MVKHYFSKNRVVAFYTLLLFILKRCIDAMGRLVMMKNLQMTIGTETIDLDKFNPGLYHLQLLLDNELVSSKRFVIIR